MYEVGAFVFARAWCLSRPAAMTLAVEREWRHRVTEDDYDDLPDTFTPLPDDEFKAAYNRLIELHAID